MVTGTVLGYKLIMMMIIVIMMMMLMMILMDVDDVDDYLVVTGTVLRYRLSLIVFCKSWSTPPLGNRVFRYCRRSEVIEPGKKKRQLETCSKGKVII